MDAEGFSGRDGRTTIFDYWSVESLRNWNNNGLFDGAKLTPAERSLREMYAKLLNVVRSEPVIVEGAFYDLMYANSGNPYFQSEPSVCVLAQMEERGTSSCREFRPCRPMCMGKYPGRGIQGS